MTAGSNGSRSRLGGGYVYRGDETAEESPEVEDAPLPLRRASQAQVELVASMVRKMTRERAARLIARLAMEREE